jgi:hypothetical protein
MALGGLAAALQLTPAERAYLFQLAGKPDPRAPRDGNGMDVPPALADALAGIAGPAYLLDRTWSARAWNQPAARLFVGWLGRGDDRNLLRYIFLNKIARTVIPDWEDRAHRVVAEFRADTSRHLEDPAVVALIDDLRGRSADFERCWTEHAVVERAGGARSFDHPKDGRLTFEQIAFTMASRPDFKLVMLVRGEPAG